MKHIRFFCGFIATLAGMANAGTYCTTGPYAGSWVNSGGCSNAAIIVAGPGNPNTTDDEVIITSAGPGVWDVVISFKRPSS